MLEAPHLLLREIGDGSAPPAQGGQHLSVQALGRVTRDHDGVVLRNYAANLVTD